ncbi:hypothetical protein J2Y41_003839 [Arthrobacter sp. 1088]|uniref:hypothetical protein n=1 Tax=Arthrobacter sp. 1088 TaxID=2817768 RepID=UPI0028671786|nr:hypothetical protein [Arthrobacter sp. 1088]MDR6688253.1 hypothetical protein [Arthrobacter sp. 1088]
MLIHAEDEELATWPLPWLHMVRKLIEQRLQARFMPPGNATRMRLEGRVLHISELIAVREGPLEGTILAHILAHLDPDGSGLIPGGEDLPDAESGSLNEIRWAPGAWEGILTHGFGISSDEETAAAMSGLISRNILRGFRAEDFDALYGLARSKEFIFSYIDVLSTVSSSHALSGAGIRQLGRRLVREGQHREPVKLGIALLGLIGDNADRELLLTLGRHEEFTLYCAIAISNVEPPDSRDKVLLSMAKSVEGWGRVHAVERLEGSTNPEVQERMLSDGYRNIVGSEYTAYIVATTGKPAEALANPDVTLHLLDAAAEILGALSNDAGPPVQRMDDYLEGPLALERFITHVEQHGPRLSHFTATEDIAVFLRREQNWEAGKDSRWTISIREEFASRCERINQHPGWAALAEKGLISANNTEFYKAERIARALGLDTYPAHWRRVQSYPCDSSWFALLQEVDEHRLPAVLAYARQSLPLGELGSGPDDKDAQSDRFRAHHALDTIVTGLAKFPGEGWDLVETCLRSPVIRNRNMAINTLEAWTPTHWGPNVLTALLRAHAAEPDDKLRQRLDSLIK